jgi:hypothetical protein
MFIKLSLLIDTVFAVMTLFAVGFFLRFMVTLRITLPNSFFNVIKQFEFQLLPGLSFPVHTGVKVPSRFHFFTTPHSVNKVKVPFRHIVHKADAVFQVSFQFHDNEIN